MNENRRRNKIPFRPLLIPLPPICLISFAFNLTHLSTGNITESAVHLDKSDISLRKCHIIKNALLDNIVSAIILLVQRHHGGLPVPASALILGGVVGGGVSHYVVA